jgi:LemA protein
MTNIMALAENYPQLRASENMQQLQEELSSTENRVAFARQAYNDNVMTYNTTQQEFPAMIFASMFGHHPVELFQVEDQQTRKAPKVSFS